jgi:hypothetical protein
MDFRRYFMVFLQKLDGLATETRINTFFYSFFLSFEHDGLNWNMSGKIFKMSVIYIFPNFSGILLHIMDEKKIISFHHDRKI